MGDFNARLQYRAEEEQSTIGPLNLGRGEEFALQAAYNTQDNREFFSAAVREHDLFPMNTHLQHDNTHLVAYTEMATLKRGTMGRDKICNSGLYPDTRAMEKLHN